jgi:hypothetical protein
MQMILTKPKRELDRLKELRWRKYQHLVIELNRLDKIKTEKVCEYKDEAKELDKLIQEEYNHDRIHDNIHKQRERSKTQKDERGRKVRYSNK